MNDEAVKWLREQIEGDKSAALIISSGGFAPERWDTDPPGQVNPERMPEADAITAALGIDPHDRAFPRHEFWTALVSWERENNEPEEDRVRESDLPTAIVNDGRREADHIRRQDPRNTVARCEAELAILDEHADGWQIGDPLRDCQWEAWPCHTLRLLASGYKHREGYAQHWAEVTPQ